MRQSIARFLQRNSTQLGIWILLAAPLHGQASDQVHELDSYVVTGTRTERILTEAPVKTELLLSNDLEDYNITSFKDALKLIPTARFENDCQNCGLNQIQLLGLSTDYTSILFDGAPMYSGLAKVYGADLFPAVFVDRIEVVKGGSSSLYGPEAIAGVVNLITVEPLQNSFRTDVSIESLLGDATETEFSFSGSQVSEDGNYALKVYGLHQDRDALDLTTDNFSEIPQFENKIIGTQAWFHPVEDGTMKLSFQYMDQAHRGGDRLDLPEEQARVAESLAHEVYMLHADWKQRLSNGMDYSLRASYVDIGRQSFYGARADNEQRAFEEAGFDGEVTDEFIANNQAAIDSVARTVWGETNNDVIYLESQVNRYAEQHVFSLGAQYRYEELEDGSLYNRQGTVTKGDFSNLGIFLQDQWSINEKWEVVSGLRYDSHDNVDGSIFSPRIATRFSANEEVTWRASWSTGFNAPGAFNEDQHISVNTGGAVILNNAADLKEEDSQTWSFGMDFIPQSLDEKLILHSQIHYTLLKDSFDIDDSGDLTGDENLWLRVNGPDSEFFVWENNINYELNEHFQIDGGLSYLKARFDEPIERVTSLTTDEYIERPEWTGHLALSYENQDVFDAYAFLSYTGTMLATGEDADIWRRTDDFWVFDIGVSKKFEGFMGDADLIIATGIDNLFDERQKDQLDNGEDRDPTYSYGPTNPRTFHVSARLAW